MILSQQDMLQILRKHDAFLRRRAGGVRAMLKFHDISRLDLEGRDLSEADLAGAKLFSTHLVDAKLIATGVD